VNNRANILEQMRELKNCSVDDAPLTSESDNSGMATPSTKKAKGLSKVLGCCLGSSHSVQLTPHQRIKLELDQYLSHPQSDVEASPHLTGGKTSLFDTQMWQSLHINICLCANKCSC